jgi:integrase
VQFLKERRDVGRAIGPEQETALLKLASEPRYPDSALYPIVVLALNTAMRSQEIKTLRWSQVDLIHRSLIVGKSKTEVGSGRIIPLNQSAAAVLAMWASRTPGASPEHFVFPACENHKINPGKPIASFRTAWRNATKTAGLPGLRFHDLRHTAITKLAESLTSEQTIMAIAGHVSRRMLEHYSHIRMEAKRTAVEVISQPVSVESGAQNWAQSPNSQKAAVPNLLKTLAGTTGLEPATSCVTGRRSNRLNYVPA